MGFDWAFFVDRIVNPGAPYLNALNERLRDDYIVDCQRGVDRWNKLIADAGIDLAGTAAREMRCSMLDISMTSAGQARARR